MVAQGLLRASALALAVVFAAGVVLAHPLELPVALEAHVLRGSLLWLAHSFLPCLEQPSLGCSERSEKEGSGPGRQSCLWHSPLT